MKSIVMAVCLSLCGCATFQRGFEVKSFKLNGDLINKEWNEVQRIYGVKAPLIPIRIVETNLSDGGLLGLYCKDHIEIYSRTFVMVYGGMSDNFMENIVYNTISHEMIHYAMDLSWKFKRPAIRQKDHCIMKPGLEKLAELNDKHFGEMHLAKEISLANLMGQFVEEKCR